MGVMCTTLAAVALHLLDRLLHNVCVHLAGVGDAAGAVCDGTGGRGQ